ncbi:MAG TPA: hypothetical protein VM925_36190, partial [Labilithrix sp.]|nr:hypothetical protein [Labilithrix sp.]
MRVVGLRLALSVVITTFALVSEAAPAPKRGPTSPPAPAGVGPTNLRAHVGTDQAARLLRSVDPDERIRGIQRAASIGTPEAIALLADSLERSKELKTDSRALLALARGLARFADHDRARAGLLAIVGSGSHDLAGRLPTTRPSSSADGME